MKYTVIIGASSGNIIVGEGIGKTPYYYKKGYKLIL